MNPFKPEVLDAMRTQVQAVAEGKVFSAQMVTQAQEALVALDTLTSFGQALEELLGAFSAFNLKPAPSPAATPSRLPASTAMIPSWPRRPRKKPKPSALRSRITPGRPMAWSALVRRS